MPGGGHGLQTRCGATETLTPGGFDSHPLPFLSRAGPNLRSQRSWDVKADAPTRQHQGRTIGFCCGVCPKKWDGWPEDRKHAFVSKYGK